MHTDLPLKICVLGQDSLADVVAEGCEMCFEVAVEPAPDCDIVWLCYDTPILENGAPDVEYVLNRARVALLQAGPKPLVLLSSQVPVGTTARLEVEFPMHSFAYSPENIRVAVGLPDFLQQDRIVVGTRRMLDRRVYRILFAPFSPDLIFTTVETAEMVKHALNCWLGMNIAFINEFSRLAEHYPTVNMSDLTVALKTERRIGDGAPLRAGGPYGLGHLARDIHVISGLAEKLGVGMPIVSHIKASNDLQPEPAAKLAA